MSTTAAENSLNSRRLFLTPPPKWETLPRAVMPRSDTRRKVPSANSPYGIAKQVQLLEKDPSRAVSLFWAAINSGDRVDSALKDMAVVMKQLNRSDEAIEAIKSFRHLCPAESQESLDNVLLELYKRSGKLQEEIQMLQIKLKHIEEGISFSGKRTKVGRCQGRKVHITIEKEYSRLLGNLAWAYLQQNDYRSAEEYYRKALSLEQDKNKQCNLAICLIHLDKMTEAKFLLQTVRTSSGAGQIDESFSRSYARATQILREFESDHSLKPINQKEAMYGETHKSFSSCTRGNLRGPSQTANANKLPGCQTLKRPSEIHQDELNGESSLLQNFHASDIGFSGSKSRNMKGTFCGSRRLHNGKTEQDCVCMKDYDASLSQTKSQRVLFTQPHKCLRLSNKGINRRGWYAEESNGGCSRKLLFQQEKESENLHLLPCYNINQEPESHRGSTSEDRRENMLGDPAKMNGESSVMSISFGVWKGDFSETDEQGKDAKDEFNLGLKTSSGGYSTRNFAEDSGGNSTSTVNSAKLIQEAENGNQIQKSKQQLKTNIEHLRDFPTREKGKSWADMVEEDDQELLNERRDSPVHDQEFPSKKSVLPPKYTPKKDSDDGEAGEDFADENGNSNIILDTTPCSLNQCESLSQNIESLVLRDGGYYTQPKYAGSSTNQRARQRFSYDQYGKQEKVQNSFVSPLQKRSLDFERGNPAPLEEGRTPFGDLGSSRGKGNKFLGHKFQNAK